MHKNPIETRWTTQWFWDQFQDLSFDSAEILLSIRIVSFTLDAANSLNRSCSAAESVFFIYVVVVVTVGGVVSSLSAPLSATHYQWVVISLFRLLLLPMIARSALWWLTDYYATVLQQYVFTNQPWLHEESNNVVASSNLTLNFNTVAPSRPNHRTTLH